MRKPNSGEIHAVIWALAVFAIAVNIARFQLENWALYDINPLVPALAITAVLWFVRPRRFAESAARYMPRFLLIPALMLAAYIFMVDVFGGFDLAPILFHLDQDVAGSNIASEFFYRNNGHLLRAFLLFVGSWLLLAFDHRLRRWDLAAAAVLIIFNPAIISNIDYVKSAFAGSPVDLSKYYAEPVVVPPQGTPPSILHVYLESNERALLDRQKFGPAMDPLEKFRKRGLELTGIGEIELTDWTLAGQVASQCGLPLFSLGFLHRNDFDLLQQDELLPNALCLPDILSKAGYSTAFMKAAPLFFAGTRKFIDAHSYERKLGYFELRGDYPEGGNEWGLDDEDIFDAAAREFRDLSASGKPVYLSVTNIGGHTPQGYVSRSCLSEPIVEKLENQTLKAFTCANLLVARMIDRMEREGLLENTIVILQSDHLAMRNTIWRDLRASVRHNFFVAFGPGIESRQIDKPMTMLSVFPTILELAGFRTKDGRAGLGVSAFSDRPSLLQQFGLSVLNRSVLGETRLRDRFWGLHFNDQAIKPDQHS